MFDPAPPPAFHQGSAAAALLFASCWKSHGEGWVCVASSPASQSCSGSCRSVPGLERAGTDCWGTKVHAGGCRKGHKSFRQIFAALQAPAPYPHCEYLVWGSEVGRKRAGDGTGIGWDIPEQIPVFLEKFKSRRRWALLQGKGNV